MNFDNYFGFFYYVTKNNFLIEKTNLFPILKDKIIKKKNLYEKEIVLEKYIIKINLENKKILLIKDFPINFLISHTILLGENAEVYEFEFEDKIYVCEKIILKGLLENENFKEKIKNPIKKNTKDYYDLKFNYDFEQPDIVISIKQYLTKYKKLDFNRIHLTKSDIIENFLPTAKSSHLKLAKKMSLPITSLIENNYIKNTNINIYDNEKLKKYLKPFAIIKEKEIVNFHKENNLILYNDIFTNYYLVNYSEIILEILKNVKVKDKFQKESALDLEDIYLNENKEDGTEEKINFEKKEHLKQINRIKKIDTDEFSKEEEKNKVIDKVSKIKEIKISSNHGRYLIPLWKSIKEQKYLEIKNLKEFEEYSGIRLNQDGNTNTEKFRNIYLQSTCAEKLLFKNKYVSDKLNTAFETLEVTQNIEYRTIEDLIIKLIYNSQKKVENLIKIDKTKEIENTKMLNDTIWILKYIIKKSVEYNLLPQKMKYEYEKMNNLNEIYLNEINNIILGIYKDYKIDKFKIISELNKIIPKLKYLCKNNIFEKENYYSLLKTVFLLKIFYKKYHKCEKTDYLEEIYLDYFKNYKFTYDKYQKNNNEIIEIFNDIVISSRLLSKEKKIVSNKKKEYKIYIKDNFEQLSKYFNEKDLIKKDLDVEKIIKPNIFILKNIFKYNWIEIANQISKYKNLPSSINDIELNLNNRRVLFKDDYYLIYNNYNGFSTIAENKYFVLLKKN